jgi:hypothetical protein
MRVWESEGVEGGGGQPEEVGELSGTCLLYRVPEYPFPLCLSVVAHRFAVSAHWFRGRAHSFSLSPLHFYDGPHWFSVCPHYFFAFPLQWALSAL